MVLDFGRKIADGLPEAVMAETEVRRAYLGEDAEEETSPDVPAQAPREGAIVLSAAAPEKVTAIR